ncbi:aspartyl/asparaginyl beta-hydroxylase domain-containing protein [Nocardia jiangsuensis]|uniref:Aspartyl/asparaginyl beta-hydroxylase domain-containing protein n=1 Tax=Nocardia jiangsuensis TaxID=1691563 RepID=A0ABV8DNJ9_9NOCA
MSDLDGLVGQIACLGRVDTATLERVRHEALTVPDDRAAWVAEYGEFQSGGWSTLSLINRSGDPRDVRIEDCSPRATSLLEQMPATREFLSSLGFRFMWVRLARLSANSFLWEHRDYQELDGSARVRLHVPLVTNSSAVLVTAGTRVQLRAGRIWVLRPTHAHGACNLLGPDRYHLLLDCYLDDRLAAAVQDAWLDAGDSDAMPTSGPEELTRRVEQALTLAGLGYHTAAEKHLLRLFYERALPEGQVYDLIADLYRRLDDPEGVRRWRTNKRLMLGELAARTLA